MRVCYSCRDTLERDLKVFRSTTCSSCGKDLKVCKNCTFYSPGLHLDCRETIDEPVTDKEKANFCSFFRFREISSAKSDMPPSESTGRKKAQKAFNELFRSDE